LAYTTGADLSWAATAGFVALILIHHRDTRLLWSQIDWSLLLFFAGLFVVVDALTRSGVPEWLFTHLPLDNGTGNLGGWLRLSAIFLIGSNVVSNVPFILVVQDRMDALPDPKIGWELLTVASTFAGNLTLLGSVANIIVAESARDIGGIGFVEYLKVGLPLAILTTLLGALWLYVFL
jgi:Na+/H+ antiporter NhaD/arsenite permease-like protein